MNRKTTKGILIGALALALAGAAIGYYLYNKGPVDVRHAKGTPVTATMLYSLYGSDTSAAQKNYSGKILEVSGQVQSLSQNQQQEQLVLLKTGAEGGHINCTMEEANPGIQPGSTVTIRGICSGMGQGDADLGIMADVYLTRCYLSK